MKALVLANAEPHPESPKLRVLDIEVQLDDVSVEATRVVPLSPTPGVLWDHPSGEYRIMEAGEVQLRTVGGWRPAPPRAALEVHRAFIRKLVRK